MHKRNKAKKLARERQLQDALVHGEDLLCSLLDIPISEKETALDCCMDTPWFSMSMAETSPVFHFQEGDTDEIDPDQSVIDWDSLPKELDPAAEQEILHRNESEVRIVEFGAGSGHLGILVAYRNPTVKVVLVERKAYSIEVARNRIEKCNLNNVQIYLHDARDLIKSGFIKSFEIGISLHSCGQLTDIALDLCLLSSASVVLSPCCYGQIAKPPPAFDEADNDVVKSSMLRQPEDCSMITVPKNQIVPPIQPMSRFHAVLLKPTCRDHSNNTIGELTKSNYFSNQTLFQTIISGADFANNFENSQNSENSMLKDSFLMAKRCMRLVDYDRSFHFLKSATEVFRFNYQFRLTSLFPLSCSPKNNVIVGRFMNPVALEL